MISNFSKKDMREYFSGYYLIPNYQREYSWEKDELEDFLEDLLSQMDTSSDSSHFLGQIVVHNDQGVKYIIDGQQRTTTSIIFLSVLRDFFDEYKDKNAEAYDDYSEINTIFIGKASNPHLVLNELDKKFFTDNIQRGKPSFTKKEDKNSHELIRKAYIYYHNKIEEKLLKYNDVADKCIYLHNVYETFANKLIVLYLEASDLAEAFTLFETLNTRGKDLETSDLLKNLILRESNEADKAYQKWNKMIGNLGDSDPTKFIRHFWNSCHDFSREKELYRSISKSVDGARLSNELLNDLEKYSSYYNDLTDPNECSKFSNKDLIKSLKSLHLMNASTYYPVILSMLQSDFVEEDIAKVAKKLENYVFRNIVISGKVANTAETFFAELALNIYKKKSGYTTIDEICEDISNEYTDDEEFKQQFSLWKGKNSKQKKDVIRYILRNIHSKLDPTNAQEINIDNDEVQIEHIMPQDIKEWSDIDEETHENYLWRLGNLALLAQKLNGTIKARPFEKKKEYYKQSYIKPNEKLDQYNKWGKTEIEERQSYLTEIAMEIWK